MRILIVEDEKKTALYLAKGLTENGFAVDLAHDGEEGLFLARNTYYDLIILDVMLPKMDGWAIITAIRKQDPHKRVLFLTARDELDDRVKGLNLGADDYLVKPFAFSELLARVKNVLRRSEIQSSPVITIADLVIDLAKHKVTRAGERIELSAKEFSLLAFFAQHQSEVLSRTLIAERVWDINFDSDTNVVDVAIRRLRQKMDNPFPQKLIHTVRGMGYVLEIR